MRITKFTHSCIRLDEGDRALVLDPGSFLPTDELPDALHGVDTVLVTHEHPDHITVDGLRAAAGRNASLRIWAPASVAAMYADLGDRVTTVAPGDSFDADGFAVQALGGQHAVIHPTVPVIPNVGYLIDERIYHPGDALIVPTVPVETLLVPIHAPWSKVAEVVDFVVSVRAHAAYPIHDALLTEAGTQLTEAHVTRIGGEHGTTYRHLWPRDTVEM
jgi:L-ascorbate metabolism protein UlaG (beta-lactamase superfamily)